ncbi:MAG: DNA primase catalytic subunit PriS, partial [Crenarchaeota archaeon]|nr:DNA primase catalytic subunit PriS [Thermoproteota archaeon]
MNEKTKAFIRDRFAEFYNEESQRIEAPKSIERREFGFLLFQAETMTRHKSFNDAEELKSFLKKNIPVHVYYSTAYYETPDEPMEKKGWMGADIYFDIDADHIPTKCAKVHDRW